MEITNFVVNHVVALAAPFTFGIWRKIARGARAVANFCYSVRRPGVR
jgi:hypothetical protein